MATPETLSLSAADLAGPVTRALGVGHVDVVDWTVESMKPGTGGATGGLYRIRGNASATEVPHTWELVLKVLRPHSGRLSTQGNVAAANGLEPHHYNYWRREALAYESGLLSDLPGVGAPRSFGVDERPDGSIWLWLEAMASSDAQPLWTAERFGFVARHLGQFNGTYQVADKPLPDHPWLSHRWLRSWLARWATMTNSATDPEPWSAPLVCAAFSDHQAALDRMRRLAAEQERLLNVLERLPQTFAHQDAFSRNIIVPPDGEHVTLIDWAFIGHAALGEEVAQLVAGTLLFGDADRHAAPQLGEAALHAYEAGLRDVGWRGDEEAVRFGYAAAASLRWAAFAIGNVHRVATADSARRSRIEQQTGQPLEASVRSYAALAEYLLALGDQALLWRSGTP